MTKFNYLIKNEESSNINELPFGIRVETNDFDFFKNIQKIFEMCVYAKRYENLVINMKDIEEA